MLFSCKCLNFMIETQDCVEPCDDTCRMSLSQHARRQELLIALCKTVLKKVDVLVVTNTNNGWTEFSCANCSAWVYSTQSKEADLMCSEIIVNKQCTTTKEQLRRLEEDPHYSNVFKIIIKELSNPRRSAAQYTDLHPLANSWLKDQTVMAEARINDFMKKEYALLDELKQQVSLEQLAINNAARKQAEIGEGHIFADFPLSKNLSAGNAGSKRYSPVADDILNVETILLDDDGDVGFTSEESDEEPPKDLPPIRAEPGAVGYARSLPIPLPVALEERTLNDRFDKSPCSPQEIAEHIRALVDSVRGNSVFGELPPPRFPSKKNQ